MYWNKIIPYFDILRHVVSIHNMLLYIAAYGINTIDTEDVLIGFLLLLSAIWYYEEQLFHCQT